MSEKIEVKVKFFASARQTVGKKDIDVGLEKNSKVEDLMDHLYEKYPELEDMKDHLLISVNKDRSDKSDPLKEGDEIAVMPPVTGG